MAASWVTYLLFVVHQYENANSPYYNSLSILPVTKKQSNVRGMGTVLCRQLCLMALALLSVRDSAHTRQEGFSHQLCHLCVCVYCTRACEIIIKTTRNSASVPARSKLLISIPLQPLVPCCPLERLSRAGCCAAI